MQLLMSSITQIRFKKTSFNLGENDRQSSPNAMKLNEMTPNSYVNYNYLKFRIISGRNTKIFNVKNLNNEEAMPFPHYLVVNQCNVDGFEWISKIMMVYR